MKREKSQFQRVYTHERRESLSTGHNYCDTEFTITREYQLKKTSTSVYIIWIASHHHDTVSLPPLHCR